MEDALKSLLTSVAPRETAGSSTVRKYGFQHDYSLHHLLQIHQEAAYNYILLFDFHDDLVVIDITHNPSQIDFYQIKSKDSKNWAVGSFINGTVDELSIVSKMYSNKVLFPDNTRTLNFVSNAAFSFKKLKSGQNCILLDIILGSDLSDEDIEKCNTAIKTQLTLDEDPSFERFAKFNKTILSNQDSKNHCIGMISEFFQKMNPENKVNCSVAYAQIKGEIERRTKYVPPKGEPTEWRNLLEKKGIDRAQFHELIMSAGLYKNIEEQWNEIQAELHRVNMGATEVIKYKLAWRNLKAMLLNDRNNSVLIDLEAAIDAKIVEALADASKNTLQPFHLAEDMIKDISLSTLDRETKICLALKKLNNA